MDYRYDPVVLLLCKEQRREDTVCVWSLLQRKGVSIHSQFWRSNYDADSFSFIRYVYHLFFHSLSIPQQKALQKSLCFDFDRAFELVRCQSPVGIYLCISSRDDAFGADLRDRGTSRHRASGNADDAVMWFVDIAGESLDLSAKVWTNIVRKGLESSAKP